MMKIKSFSIPLFPTLICALFTLAQAQTPRVTTVNITPDADKVHIATVGEVSEMRIEVSDEQGEVVFQSGAITGQTLDWKMTDAQGERVAPGTYLVTVTFRTTAGKLRKRVEQVTVSEDEKASTEAAAPPAPNAVQATITGAGTAGKIAKFTGAATIGNSVITESAGRIGIGTDAPDSPLHVKGASSVLITANNTRESGTGVQSFGAYIGVVGSGEAYGVQGLTSSGTGVYGQSYTKNGVHGFSGSSNGVYGQSDSGFGVRGQSRNSAGVSAFSTIGPGVHGQSTKNNGVVGLSTDGVGIYGQSNRNDGVVGKSFENAHSGVVGTHTGSGFGVFGESVSGFAGYFAGKVRVTGTLTKGGGSFQIDHPLDPANKYLSHSFVESPDMKNIYDGNITTDANGNATITLPNYFQALNRDFRYQLTVIGEFAQASVSQEIKDNRFQIRTDKPNVKVSWQVTGIRKDAWAEAHRIPVEEDKPEKERGTYLHPEVFNQPKEKGVEQARQAEQTRKTTTEAAQAQTTGQK